MCQKSPLILNVKLRAILFLLLTTVGYNFTPRGHIYQAQLCNNIIDLNDIIIATTMTVKTNYCNSVLAVFCIIIMIIT